jgi:hypothetical protein
VDHLTGALVVDGGAGIGRDLNVSGNIVALGTIRAQNTFTTISDYRFKKDIRPLADSVLGLVPKLVPIRYKLKAGEQSMQHPVVPKCSKHVDESNQRLECDKDEHYGFVAQDLARILPALVYMDKNDKNSVLSVDYSRLSVINLRAIQELLEIVQALQIRLERAERKLCARHGCSIKDD